MLFRPEFCEITASQICDKRATWIIAFPVLRRYAWLPERLKGAGRPHIIVYYRNTTVRASLTQNCNGGSKS
jgi:hypothetical protein